jgi:hypothetical protein
VQLFFEPSAILIKDPKQSCGEEGAALLIAQVQFHSESDVDPLCQLLAGTGFLYVRHDQFFYWPHPVPKLHLLT